MSRSLCLMSASCQAEPKVGIQSHKSRGGGSSGKPSWGGKGQGGASRGRSGPAALGGSREQILTQGSGPARCRGQAAVPCPLPTPPREVPGKGCRVPSQLCQRLLRCHGRLWGCMCWSRDRAGEWLWGRPLGKGTLHGACSTFISTTLDPLHILPMGLKALICPPPSNKKPAPKPPAIPASSLCQRRSIEAACGKRMDPRGKSVL